MFLQRDVCFFRWPPNVASWRSSSHFSLWTWPEALPSHEEALRFLCLIFFGLDQDLSYVQLCFWCYAHESAIVPKQVLPTVSTSCIINYQLLQFKYALCSKFQKIIAWNHTSLDKNSRKQCYVLLLFWHTCKHLTKWIQKNSKCSVRLDQSKLSRPSRNVTLWPSEHLKESLLVLVSRSLATSPNQERLRRSIVTV